MSRPDRASCILPRVFCLALACSPVLGNTTEHVCARVVGPEKRLACYDAAFPPTPEAMARAERDAEDSFGRPHAGAGMAFSAPSGPDAGRITSTVASVSHQGSTRTVTLGNGQVWVLIEATSRGQMQAGDHIEVRRAAMGSFLLVTQAGVSLRVRRLR